MMLIFDPFRESRETRKKSQMWLKYWHKWQFWLCTSLFNFKRKLERVEMTCYYCAHRSAVVWSLMQNRSRCTGAVHPITILLLWCLQRKQPGGSSYSPCGAIAPVSSTGTMMPIVPWKQDHWRDVWKRHFVLKRKWTLFPPSKCDKGSTSAEVK